MQNINKYLSRMKKFPTSNRYLKLDKYHKYNKIRKIGVICPWPGWHHYNIYPQTSSNFTCFFSAPCLLETPGPRGQSFYTAWPLAPQLSFHNTRPVGTGAYCRSAHSAHHRRPVNLRDEILRQGILLPWKTSWLRWQTYVSQNNHLTELGYQVLFIDQRRWGGKETK